ncbi:MAG TPA: DUF952 domain-containing protein [Candidatus Kapabacteria bacterium]|jgi:uncharacterized protein (DUF952 family)|nr:DUF952 domain-containing protein [Candidatus Kapabacteria bacterium]
MIYHFVTEEDLAQALTAAEYAPKSLEKEGFIHCSRLDQVIAVANFLAPYDESMYLFEIDESKVNAKIKYEDAMNNRALYPHIYGPLNRDAIVNKYPLDWDGEEGYQLPETLRKISK